MTAYVLAQIDVKDIEDYREYMKHTPRIISQYGGRFLVRGGEMETLEGPGETLRMILIEFPSMEQAKTFYHSEEYTLARELRGGAGIARIIAIDGFTSGQWEEAVSESSQYTLP